MGRIVVLNNPMDINERVEYEHVGPFIDFLQRHYPQGFGNPHVTALNLRQLPVADYDVEIGDDDLVVIAVNPGVSAILPVIINALIGLAVNFGLSFLIGDQDQANQDDLERESVYTMTTPKNTARIGQPIPVNYGRNWIVPDFGMRSYSYFADNEMFVVNLYVLGHGRHHIDQILIGETDINDEEISKNIMWWNIMSDVHQQRLGAITELTEESENVFTSDEVYDVEFPGDPEKDLGEWLGWYSVNPINTATNHLQVDIVLPGGLYHVEKDGDIKSNKICFVFQLERERQPFSAYHEEADCPVVEEHRVCIEDRTKTPIRRTFDLWLGSPGRWKIRGRIDYLQQAHVERDVWTSSWYQCKAFLHPNEEMGSTIYGDVHLLMIRFRASKNLNSQGAERVKVDATRIDQHGSPIVNPVDVFKDIFTNPDYGAGRPVHELDHERLDELRERCADCTFNHIYSGSTTIWKALQDSLRMRFAAPTLIGALLTAIEDKEYFCGKVRFTEDNIINISLAYHFGTGDEPDGVEGAYVDPADGATVYEIFPADSAEPKQVSIPGCTQRSDALAYIERLWKQMKYRRRLVTLEVEMEGHLLVYGTPIRINHEIFAGLDEEDVEDQMAIVRSVEPGDDGTFQIEAFLHEPRVFE